MRWLGNLQISLPLQQEAFVLGCSISEAWFLGAFPLTLQMPPQLPEGAGASFKSQNVFQCL